MKRVMSALLGLWFLAAATIASDSPFNSNVPDQYTVKRNDTLWDIADHFLSEPWVWPEIWHVNPQIKNPHLIYPGDIINMVYIDGKPHLSLSRGRNVKLSPEVREVAHLDAISSLPLDTINSFLSKTRITQPGELELAPYVISGYEGRLLSGEGDNLYARGSFTGDEYIFGLYRKGDPYIDPVTQEVLGVRAQDIGSVKLMTIDDDIASLQATRTTEEVRVGDRLLEEEDRNIDSIFYPSAPPEDSRGVIISVEDGLHAIGTLDVIAVNLGERDGVESGNLMAIYKAGEKIKDRIAGDTVVLPPERIGLMMVFRTFDKMSFGLVLSAQRPFNVGDLVRSP